MPITFIAINEKVYILFLYNRYLERRIVEKDMFLYILYS